MQRDTHWSFRVPKAHFELAILSGNKNNFFNLALDYYIENKGIDFDLDLVNYLKKTIPTSKIDVHKDERLITLKYEGVVGYEFYFDYEEIDKGELLLSLRKQEHYFYHDFNQSIELDSELLELVVELTKENLC